MPSALAQAAPPSYQSSDPSKDAMLDHPPAEVTVTFDQPLDQSSWMNVLDECGKEIDAGPATVDLNEITVAIGDDTPSGMYEVVYKAVGVAGATGSSASSFEFMVHHGEPCGEKKHDHDDEHPKKHDDDEHPKNHDDDGHDDHDDMGSDDHSDHSGMSTPGHSGHMTDSGSGHGPGHGGRHGDHGGKPGDRKPADTGGTGTEPPPFAGGPGDVPVGADGQAVLIGLGLALGVGVLGGWLLRVSSSLAEA